MFRGRGERLVLTAAPGPEIHDRRRLLRAAAHVRDRQHASWPAARTTARNCPISTCGRSRRGMGLERDLSDHWRVSFGPTVEGTEMWDLSQPQHPRLQRRHRLHARLRRLGPAVVFHHARHPDHRQPRRARQPVRRADVRGHRPSSTRRSPPASSSRIHGEGFDAHVLEVSGNAGVIGGKAPVFDRFYAGGLGSVRGFDVWGISPQFNGAPIGGYWMLTGSAEYSFPLIHVSDEVYFRGALFADCGDVETTPAETGPHPHRLRRRPARRVAEGQGIDRRSQLRLAGEHVPRRFHPGVHLLHGHGAVIRDRLARNWAIGKLGDCLRKTVDHGLAIGGFPSPRSSSRM